jgi:hypothetical protein
VTYFFSPDVGAFFFQLEKEGPTHKKLTHGVSAKQEFICKKGTWERGKGRRNRRREGDKWGFEKTMS